MASALASSSFLSAAAPSPSTGVARSAGRPTSASARSAGLEGLRARECAALAEKPASATFSSSDSRRNGRGIWKVRPMPRLMIAVRRQARDLAALEADRARVGAQRAGEQLKIVLLPEPFGPIRPRISPCSTSNETLLTAVKPPKRLVSPRRQHGSVTHSRPARYFAA